MFIVAFITKRRWESDFLKGESPLGTNGWEKIRWSLKCKCLPFIKFPIYFKLQEVTLSLSVCGEDASDYKGGQPGCQRMNKR